MSNENLSYAINALLEEAQQVKIVEDTASTGKFNAVLEGNTLIINGGEFSNLTSDLITVDPDTGEALSGIHLHMGKSGENGDIIGNLIVTDNGDGSGRFNGKFELNETQVEAAFADGLYVNLYTEENPTGELRGQIELDATNKVILNPNDVQEPSMGGIDLRNLAEDKFVEVKFHITREADFDNVVDFYKADGAGNVVDESGNTIAPGEEGYQAAAIANRLGFDFSVDDEQEVTVTKDLSGGFNYAPMVVVRGTFEQLTDDDPSNDPQVYFAYEAANPNGVKHIESEDKIRDMMFEKQGDLMFGFEDLPGGGDLDYNDITFDIDIV